MYGYVCVQLSRVIQELVLVQLTLSLRLQLLLLLKKKFKNR